MENPKPSPLPEKNNDALSEKAPANYAEEPLFFNVMPKVAGQQGMIEPSIQVRSPQISSESEAARGPSGFSKYKFYVIAALAVVALGVAAYFLAPKFFGGNGEGDNLLVANPDAGGNTDAADIAAFATTEEWRTRYFPDCQINNLCGDKADPDQDGLANAEEFARQTDPNNADSDQDGLADGDEVAVFGSNPLDARTSGNPEYQDADFVKGGYGFSDNKPLSREQLDIWGSKMRELGLHQPTLTTVGDYLLTLYNFNGQNPVSPDRSATSTPPADQASTTPLSGFDMSLEAKQDRDAQRTGTIKNFGIALLKYFDDYQKYPATRDFKEVYDAAKPYLKVATNPADPINQDPYVYGYEPNNSGNDFTLSFYSEVAGQLIKKHAAEAQKDRTAEDAAIFDDQRRNDLETLRTALLLYSNHNIAGGQEYVFPTEDKFKTDLVPGFISAIPHDPKTGQAYEYRVSENFDTFTLKAVFDSPKPGTSGYLCNQEECREY